MKLVTMTKARIISSSDFKNQPQWFNTLNRLWKKTYPHGKVPQLNKDDLIKTARRKTGLNDLGKDFWDEPLPFVHRREYGLSDWNRELV